MKSCLKETNRKVSHLGNQLNKYVVCLRFLFFFLILRVLPACIICVHVHAMPTESIRGLQISWNRSCGCELTRGCWELDLGPLHGQPVLSTTKPSLQFHLEWFLFL